MGKNEIARHGQILRELDALGQRKVEIEKRFALIDNTRKNLKREISALIDELESLEQGQLLLKTG